MEHLVKIEKTINSLYLVGSFNDFNGGDEYEFNLDSNNTWILSEVILKGGDVFKFSERSDLSGDNWGDNEPDSIADKFGSSIVLPGNVGEAFYKVTFNDLTFEYNIDFVKFPSISIIGSATTGDDSGWSQDTFMRDFGDGTFRHALGFYVGAFKFRQNESWDNNWGNVSFPEGGTTSKNGSDIQVEAGEEGTYIVIFNPGTGNRQYTNSLIYNWVLKKLLPSIPIFM